MSLYIANMDTELVFTSENPPRLREIARYRSEQICRPISCGR